VEGERAVGRYGVGSVGSSAAMAERAARGGIAGGWRARAWEAEARKRVLPRAKRGTLGMENTCHEMYARYSIFRTVRLMEQAACGPATCRHVHCRQKKAHDGRRMNSARSEGRSIVWRVRWNQNRPPGEARRARPETRRFIERSPARHRTAPTRTEI